MSPSSDAEPGRRPERFASCGSREAPGVATLALGVALGLGWGCHPAEPLPPPPQRPEVGCAWLESAENCWRQAVDEAATLAPQEEGQLTGNTFDLCRFGSQVTVSIRGNQGSPPWGGPSDPVNTLLTSTAPSTIGMVTLEDWSRSVQIFVDVAQPRGNIRFGGWSFGGEWGTATVETPHVAGDGVSVKNGRYVVTCNAQLPAVTLPLAQLQACPQALPGWRATKAQGLLTIELFGGSRPTRVLTCREQAIAAGR